MSRKITYRKAYKKGMRKYDSRDYYRDYKKKHKTKISENKFRQILIDMLMQLFDEKLMKYARVALPHGIGELYIEDVKCGFQNANGVVYKRDLVDWPKTRELWKIDQSMQKKRIYVYQDLTHYAKFQYNTPKNKCHNINFYDLILSMNLRDRIYWELTQNDPKHLKNR